MTNSQREALERHIPTTEVIRDAVTFPRDRLGEPLDISAERFDKWLAGVKAETLREAASDRTLRLSGHAGVGVVRLRNLADKIEKGERV